VQWVDPTPLDIDKETPTSPYIERQKTTATQRDTVPPQQRFGRFSAEALVSAAPSLWFSGARLKMG